MTTKRALVCAPLLPAFDRESGSKRVFDFVAFLQDAGWAVSFFAENGAGGERYADILRQRGVPTYSDQETGPDELIAAGRFDLAILAFWYIAERYLPVIRALSPRTRVIVDSVDLHFLRNARRVFRAAGERGDRAGLDAEAGSEMAREINAYAAADAVFAVSRREADLINDLVGVSALAHHVPDGEAPVSAPPPFADRTGSVFVGNFWHPPNAQAVEHLCGEIVPRLPPALTREHPIYLVGNGLGGRMRRVGRGLVDVKMVGWVPSVLPYVRRGRISVVPLLYGAGTKRKVIQSLIAGTPVVSTSIGVEGLDLAHGEHVLIADEPGDFAAAMVRLLADESLWERLARQGRERVTRDHDREVARERFLEEVNRVLDENDGPPIGGHDAGMRLVSATGEGEQPSIVGGKRPSPGTDPPVGEDDAGRRPSSPDRAGDNVRDARDRAFDRPSDPLHGQPAGDDVLTVETTRAVTGAVPGKLSFRCNVCGQGASARVVELERETPSCATCGSTVRWRSVVHVLSQELLGESLALPDFPTRPDIVGIGLSDWDGYALPLAEKLTYTNTQYHTEPRLDITTRSIHLERSLDFLISSEVFEHVAPPISRTFANARALLKPGGVMILTVPYGKHGPLVEHFPELYQYELVEEDDRPVLVNMTRAGARQVFADLEFHGGAGATLEMRRFSEPSLLSLLEDAGFGEVKTYKDHDFEHGIYWSADWSLPIAARVP